MAEYTKEQLNKIASSASFVESMCVAINIINDAIATHGDILVKKDVAQIQRAYELLKDAIQVTADNIKKETNGELTFDIGSW